MVSPSLSIHFYLEKQSSTLKKALLEPSDSHINIQLFKV